MCKLVIRHAHGRPWLPRTPEPQNPRIPVFQNPQRAGCDPQAGSKPQIYPTDLTTRRSQHPVRSLNGIMVFWVPPGRVDVELFSEVLQALIDYVCLAGQMLTLILLCLSVHFHISLVSLGDNGCSCHGISIIHFHYFMASLVLVVPAIF